MCVKCGCFCHFFALFFFCSYSVMYRQTHNPLGRVFDVSERTSHNGSSLLASKWNFRTLCIAFCALFRISLRVCVRKGETKWEWYCWTETKSERIIDKCICAVCTCVYCLRMWSKHIEISLASNIEGERERREWEK